MNGEDNHASMKGAERIGYLIAGYITNTLTEEERDELDEWVTASEENMRLFSEMTDEENIIKGLKERSLYDADRAVDLLRYRIESQRKSRRLLPPYAIGIAASVILLAGLFVLIPILSRKEKPIEPVTETVAKSDPAPGSNKAILRVAGGKEYVLDSVDGSLMHRDNLNVVNRDGRLSYEGKTGTAEEHTLTVPNGGQYQLTLPDGTKVWLNAGSTLTYPTAFTGTERRVRASGELYFEVAHDLAHPFILSKGDVSVKVLGTHFTINAYDKDEAMRVTLLQGSVEVKSGGGTQKSEMIIKPGEQAIVKFNSPITIDHSPDLDEVMAWKNGLFRFRNKSIEKIMQQVARWYDVKIKYEGTVTDHFNATINRNVPASKLLHLLELTNRVHFTVSNDTIIVKP